MYLFKSVADLLDRTVFPMSTMSLRIFWLTGSASVVASLSLACGIRLESGW